MVVFKEKEFCATRSKNFEFWRLKNTDLKLLVEKSIYVAFLGPMTAKFFALPSDGTKNLCLLDLERRHKSSFWQVRLKGSICQSLCPRFRHSFVSFCCVWCLVFGLLFATSSSRGKQARFFAPLAFSLLLLSTITVVLIYRASSHLSTQRKQPRSVCECGVQSGESATAPQFAILVKKPFYLHRCKLILRDRPNSEVMREKMNPWRTKLQRDGVRDSRSNGRL